jgi:transcriptional regulator with XRE-family HTH domain
MMDIGKNIKRIRKEKGMSQRELAEKLGVTQSVISTYETGNPPQRITTLNKIADVLQVHVRELTTAVPSKKEEEAKNNFCNSFCKHKENKQITEEVMDIICGVCPLTKIMQGGA